MTTLPDGRLHRIATDLFSLESRYADEGPQFVRTCARHDWASVPSELRSETPTCPHCELEQDKSGQRRFADLNARLYAQEFGVSPFATKE